MTQMKLRLTCWQHHHDQIRWHIQKHLHYQSAFGQQTWQGDHLIWWLLPIKSYDTLIMWSSEIMWHIKTILSPILLSMVTKLGRMVSNLEGVLSMLLDLLVKWSMEITWQTKTVYTATMHITTKCARGMTYYKGVPPINLHDDIMWLREIMWQTKNISPLQQCLWLQNLAPCYSIHVIWS